MTTCCRLYQIGGLGSWHGNVVGGCGRVSMTVWVLGIAVKVVGVPGWAWQCVVGVAVWVVGVAMWVVGMAMWLVGVAGWVCQCGWRAWQEGHGSVDGERGITIGRKQVAAWPVNGGHDCGHVGEVTWVCSLMAAG